MLRSTIQMLTLSLAVALTAGAAGAQVRDGLATDLHRFVDAFELSQVPPAGQARLQMIVDHPEASHVAKVLAIHDILQDHDALRHVDMHGDAPTLHSELRN
ncbi:hypothetical protein [Mameliella sediminis]|uniref:hypothetical protein n=1 Tax=Mameliella sediminis TaxID=2836866 RepID=UPI001C48B5F4|nr:hypothetical protein [Mameliella sediminis]MBY6112930.1 hypothetical protein [Antarctobacter heliothermus]MBY6143722.1 hypothetical protein [Mameliella alba]MBV7394212.1 hypothetical protein [Mameliella sediminis]MBY6162376.1 hypothetical protein [Mameliella alba]MBY6170850.1 hypothetical protein [Mameliella alba]